MKRSNFNDFMQEALLEAGAAYRNGEVPVGCVIVDKTRNQIIAAAHNMVEQHQNPILHAEIIAIELACRKLASKNLSKCDIYVTLEPCAMCAGAIAAARIENLYYGAEDLKQGAVENGARFFTLDTCLHRPNIYAGIKGEESRMILQSFFSQLRKKQL